MNLATIKTRVSKESNYKAFFYGIGKTIRFKLDNSKPISSPKYPEFYDVDIFETLNGLCDGGCPYCYLNGNKKGGVVLDAVEKLSKYFGEMENNDKPFQVALPGSGEIFLHPQWKEILKAIYEAQIVPNYTTNGTFSTDKTKVKEVLDYTEKYVGGVAITCHTHLDPFWKAATKIFTEHKIRTNLHLIISNKKSIDRFISVYNEWKDAVDYFVLLPMGAPQTALKGKLEWEYLIEKLPNSEQIAYGANFYPYLQEGKIKVSLYDPEMFGGFLALDKMKVYKSSFCLEERIVP